MRASGRPPIMDERATSARRAKALLQWDSENEAGYVGTRTQLIDAGLARPGDFPGDPESGRVTSHTFTRDGKRVAIHIKSKVARPMTFTLWIGETNAQRHERKTKEENAEKRKAADAAA